MKPGEFEQMLGEAEPDHGLADRDGQDTAVILYTIAAVAVLLPVILRLRGRGQVLSQLAADED